MSGGSAKVSEPLLSGVSRGTTGTGRGARLPPIGRRPALPATVTVVPDRRRLIALEDARDWLKSAIQKLELDDVPGALYGVHTAIKHAEEARDVLIELLIWDGDDEEL